MSQDLTPVPPENSRELTAAEEVLGEVGDLKREAKRLRAQTAIPAIKAMKDEIVRRAQSGELKEQLKGMKLSALLRDLNTIKQVLEDNMPQVVMLTPPAPASDGKDQTWRKAHSIVGKTEAEREKMRNSIEGETA